MCIRDRLYGVLLVICTGFESFTGRRCLCDLGGRWNFYGRNFELFYFQTKPQRGANGVHWFDCSRGGWIKSDNHPLNQRLSPRMRARVDIHQPRRINIRIALRRREALMAEELLDCP